MQNHRLDLMEDVAYERIVCTTVLSDITRFVYNIPPSRTQKHVILNSKLKALKSIFAVTALWVWEGRICE